MVSLQIHDATSSVMVAIPEKHVQKNQWDFEVGKWVHLQRIEARQKFPKKLCMLVTEKSKVKFLDSSQIPKELKIEPEKLGFSLD